MAAKAGLHLVGRHGVGEEIALHAIAACGAEDDRLGFLLDAFKYGPPPHGGMAFGWDRVIKLLAGAETIRDVIAFPKAASGADPLTGAPTPITPAQRKEAGIDAKPAPPAKPA